MPNEGSKLARCIRPNGDEWHLKWDQLEQQRHRIVLIPQEKMRELGLRSPFPEGGWYAVCAVVGGGYQVGPFKFVDVDFPQ